MALTFLVLMEGKMTHPESNAENADIRTRNV